MSAAGPDLSRAGSWEGEMDGKWGGQDEQELTR